MTRSKPFWLVLVVLVLAGGLYAVFRPGPPPAPQGPEFTLQATKAYGVENPHAGPLYIIEGTATNNMGIARCRIQIKAALLDADGKEVAQEEALAGPAVSISELKFLEWDELRAKLAPAWEDPCRESLLAPGGTAPFMAVFRRPPANAATYSVSATGSQAPGANSK